LFVAAEVAVAAVVAVPAVAAEVGVAAVVAGVAAAAAHAGDDAAGAEFHALERDDFSSNHHPARSFCLSMISAQTLRVCREGKPLFTFPDHALADER
jgi:hypothetical protein